MSVFIARQIKTFRIFSERFFCAPFPFSLPFYSPFCYTEFMDYKTLYEKNAAWFNARPRFKRILLLLNALLPCLFILLFAGTLVVIALVANNPLSREELAVFIAQPATALLIVSALRLLIARPRPYAEDGAQICPLVKKTSGSDSSCPSRHVTSAVSISLALLSISIPLGIFALCLAFGLAYIRFAVGVHYPSDLTLGASIAFFSYAAYTIVLAIL